MARRLVLAWLVTVLTLVSAGPASAAPSRNDSANEPVYFVPGYTDAQRHDCWGGYWKPAADAMRTWGWTGSYHTVSFYAGDVSCNTKILNGSVNTPIQELGRVLAWNIYSSFSQHGISVDVAAHSMGGLVVRAALTGVARRLSGWPPYLYIEDVVTFATPHQGSGWAWTCSNRQCVDMRPGSDFLNWLYQAPQSAQGTDWTLMGSDEDNLVSTDTALGMSAGHKIRYYGSAGIEHSEIHQTVSGSYEQAYWNYYDDHWYYTTNAGASPVRSGNNALYHWWRW